MFYTFKLAFKTVISLLLLWLAYGVYAATLFAIFVVEWRTFPIVNHTVHLWYGDTFLTVILVLGYALGALIVIATIGVGIIGNLIRVVASWLVEEIPHVADEIGITN